MVIVAPDFEDGISMLIFNLQRTTVSTLFIRYCSVLPAAVEALEFSCGFIVFEK
jgi:hypothetical protein